MPEMNFTKTDLPGLFGGTGTITVHVNVPQLTQPFPPSTSDLLTIDFGTAGNQPFVFGTANSIKLGVQAGANSRLAVFTPGCNASDLNILSQYGLDRLLESQPDNVVLGLLIGANASVTAAASATYSVLTASATLDAGGAVAYSYFRAYPKTGNAEEILRDFFTNLKSPGSVDQPLPLGEVISFDYNGYLKVGAGLSVGYELKGAPSFDIGQLKLSEHYDLSVIGKLSLTANIAGEFSIEVCSAQASDGTPMSEWLRVIVKKKRNSQFGIAADVNVEATSQLQGLPNTGNEFLGALLGVRAKNWLNMFSQIEKYTDPNSIKQELDGLATTFLDEWLGKAFNALSASEFNTFLQNVQKVVDSYENLDNSAITLFDKYFDRLDTLTSKLKQLQTLTAWDQLKGEINNDLWDVVQQLTDGDPLDWILGQIQIPGTGGQPVTIPSLPQLQSRIQQTLALIQSDAHTEIRKVIALAKSSFGLDGFFNQLNQIDSIPKLKGLAEQKLGAFVERLLGKAVDQMSNSELGAAFKRIHQVLAGVQNFESNLYGQFKAAANQSLGLAMNVAYNKATDNDALIDIFINMSTDVGKRIFQSVTGGDFAAALANYQPEAIRLNQGLLTHSVTKSTSFSVNVVGWHGGWHYQGVDSVVVNTAQQIVPEANAALTVYTTIDMTAEKTRQRASEKLLTNLMLRFVGESHGILAFDKDNQQYLIDAITGMEGTYELSFQNQNAKLTDLQYYLSFASSFGLTGPVANLNNLLPLLPPVSQGGNTYGQVTVDYNVRYKQEALRRLFAAPFDDSGARKIIRMLVLANYLEQSDLTNIGWCYWTSDIYSSWKAGQAEFTNHSAQQFSPIDASPFASTPTPANSVLSRDQLQILSTLYYIEDDFISGFQKLDSLVHGTQIQPHAFENALSGIGSALNRLDNFSEGINTAFCLFDQLVRKIAGSDARVSSLDLKSTVAGKSVEKVLLAG